MQANIIRCLSQARISWEAEIAAERALDVKMGNMEVGALIVWMGWRPDGLSVHLPLLSFPPP